MISCSDAVRQLWEFLDGAVTAADRARIEEHLAFCRRCCGEVEFAHELRRFLAGHAADDVPADVLDRLRSTLDHLEDQP
ncbi:MAG: zf-HC2 domain-containing protein [Acidimicrobiales bacterium]